jgi:tetratricopeptide (TPR) repeat protein
MERLSIFALVVLGIAVAGTVGAREVDDYIEEARGLQQSNQTEKAMEVMQAAVEEHPGDSNANAYLGLYTGMAAGRTTDYAEAGRLVTSSFEHLDEAVALDPDNILARYFRGIMGVSVPDFLGKTEAGVRDLRFVVAAREADPESVSDDTFIQGLNLLGRALMKQGRRDQAKAAFEKIIEVAPDSDAAESARKTIAGIEEAEAEHSLQLMQEAPPTPEIADIRDRIEADPDNPALLVDLGRAYLKAGYLDAAELALKNAIEMDSSSADAYVALVEVLGAKAESGYDEKIYEDTDYMTDLAFEIMRVTERAVELDPQNLEMRLTRDIIGVEMPFFVGRLDNSIEDLSELAASDVPDEIKSRALFWLGQANVKKAMTYWIRVVTDYPDLEAAGLVFDAMNPGVQRVDLSEYTNPVAVIDFVLGFRDELPPQTAVWVETAGGDFVKTVYVSGFSGFAKEQQINLPVWSATSEFVDADGVTAASIDIGQHIYVWELDDHEGARVKPGDYVVKVEVSYWPSMKYQMVEAPVTVGEEETRTVIEEGDFIPHLEVRYVP